MRDDQFAAGLASLTERYRANAERAKAGEVVREGGTEDDWRGCAELIERVSAMLIPAEKPQPEYFPPERQPIGKLHTHAYGPLNQGENNE